MNKIIIFVFRISIALCLISLSSCDRLSRIMQPTIPEDDTFESSQNNIDSISETKDSLNNEKDSSIDLIETSNKAKEMEDKITNQSDSINQLYSRIIDLEKKVNNMINKTFVYLFMFFIFVFILVICFLYWKLNRRTQKIKRTIKDIKSTENGVSENHVITIVNKGLKDLADKATIYNSKQDKRIDDIVKRIIRLEDSKDIYGLDISNSSDSISQQKGELSKLEESEKSNVFYMPRTLKPMQFDNSKKIIIKDENAYFKFTKKKNGKVEFVFDPYDYSYIGRAYDDRENSLLTVCDVDSKSSTPKTFKNITPGEAELRDNIWFVTKKLKLQYV